MSSPHPRYEWMRAGLCRRCGGLRTDERRTCAPCREQMSSSRRAKSESTALKAANAVMTLDEIATTMGVTRERVRQIEVEALRQIREGDCLVEARRRLRQALVALLDAERRGAPQDELRRLYCAVNDAIETVDAVRAVMASEDVARAAEARGEIVYVTDQEASRMRMFQTVGAWAAWRKRRAA